MLPFLGQQMGTKSSRYVKDLQQVKEKATCLGKKQQQQFCAIIYIFLITQVIQKDQG